MPTPSVPNPDFVAGTTIKSSEVDANFAALVALLSILDSLNLAAKGINPDRLADGANPEIFFPPIAPASGFVLTGLTAGATALLTQDISSGIAWALKTSAGIPNTWVYVRKTTTTTVSGLSANSDNYIDLKGDGNFVVVSVSVGANEPPLTTDATRILLATTNATVVISTTDKRTTSFTIQALPTNHLDDLFLESDTTTPDEKIVLAANARIRSSDDSTDMSNSVALTLDATTTGAGGLDAGALGNNEEWNLYYIEDTTGVNADALFADQAFPAVLPGTHDKQRLIGSFFTDGTADIHHYSQHNERVRFYDGDTLSTSVGSNSFANVAFTRTPTRAKFGILALNGSQNAAASTVFTSYKVRIGGSTGTSGGYDVIFLTQTNANDDDSQTGETEVALDSSQQYAFRASNATVANALTHAGHGYIDEL